MWRFIKTLDSMLLSVINGLRAITIQPYDEMNKKRGLQFAASRMITGAVTSTGVMNSAGVYYSIIRTGSKPIDLKSREFARTGAALVADIFENPVYTGGTPDPVYNANGIVSHDFEFDLLVGITLTDEGAKFAATIYALGPDSNQSKGADDNLYGTNYILSPNTSYLLKFYSTDPLPQNIAVRIEGYEGDLDYPNSDYE
jgi:hypothetical protein